MYVSRKLRGKKTWQLEREIEHRPGLMERSLAALKERKRCGEEEPKTELASSQKKCVDKFNIDHPFERTVFVIMRFEGGNPNHDTKLKNLFDFLALELIDFGLETVRADVKDYSSTGILWDNVLCYLHGSKYGIAVLDDLYSEEINPNVALEYGYMLALGKKVLLLKSRSFQNISSDMHGKLWKEFEFENRESIRKAIEAWMVDLDIIRIKT